MEIDIFVQIWELLVSLGVEEILVRKDGMAEQLPKSQRSLQNVFPQLNEFAPNFSQVLEPVFWVLLEQLDNNVDHVVREDVVFKERWDFVYILGWAVFMQPLVVDVL